MPDSSDAPRPDEDDALLVQCGDELVRSIDAALDRWVAGVCGEAIAQVASAPLTADAMQRLVVAYRAVAVPDLTDLLRSDVDAQRDTPLSVLRRATAVFRDEFARAGVPDAEPGTAASDDHWGLGPVTWADLGPDVVDAGLRWGAAKAFVHRRRHR